MTARRDLDPKQRVILKLMPLAFGVFFFTFPWALVVYVGVNLVLFALSRMRSG